MITMLKFFCTFIHHLYLSTCKLIAARIEKYSPAMVLFAHCRTAGSEEEKANSEKDFTFLLLSHCAMDKHSHSKTKTKIRSQFKLLCIYFSTYISTLHCNYHVFEILLVSCCNMATNDMLHLYIALNLPSHHFRLQQAQGTIYISGLYRRAIMDYRYTFC